MTSATSRATSEIKTFRSKCFWHFSAGVSIAKRIHSTLSASLGGFFFGLLKGQENVFHARADVKNPADGRVSLGIKMACLLIWPLPYAGNERAG